MELIDRENEVTVSIIAMRVLSFCTYLMFAWVTELVRGSSASNARKKQKGPSTQYKRPTAAQAQCV